MALSAASPFYRGYVSDIDCRWGVISASVDDRTREERGLEVGMIFLNSLSVSSKMNGVTVTTCNFEFSLKFLSLVG